MSMVKHYAFAGLEFTVEITEEDRLWENDGLLEEFRVDAVGDPHCFRFSRMEKLPSPWGEIIAEHPDILVYRHGDTLMHYRGSFRDGWRSAYLCGEHNGKNHLVTVTEEDLPGGVGAKTVLNSMLVEHLIAQKGGFVFHCAFVEYEGKAILFTAPSETGKTTQAELWKQYRDARIINGDRAAVRLTEGKLLAEGIPFAGSSSYCQNRSLPIQAIVYLDQAPVTTVRRMNGLEAFCRIWEGISAHTWDREDMELVSRTAQTVAEQVPIFFMPCTPDEEAVAALEQELRKLVNV